ncbi:peroxidase superfamily protein [Striga asiatica]|uniref:Peroxidase superfamily protein n=1 Tax=Striga asiatica TaxID=4170 RepID=A0A5A7PAE0_STRAF|nr:peroxidase superfamily protein [Striga asiatica]
MFILLLSHSSPTHPPTTHTRNRSRSLAGRSSTPLHAGSSCVRPAAPPLHQDGWFRFRGCAGAVKPAGRNGRRRAELHLEAGGQVTDAAAADPDRERCVLTGNANFVSRGAFELKLDAAAAVAAKGKAVVGQGRRPLQARINSKRSRLAIEGAPAPKTPPSSILQKFKSMGNSYFDMALLSAEMTSNSKPSTTLQISTSGGVVYFELLNLMDGS